MSVIRTIVRAMYAAGELTREDAQMVYSVASMTGEDSPEAVCSVMDSMGLDGSVVFDYADELDY